MTISFDDFQQTLRDVEDLQREKDRTDGARKQLIATLKKEFGCDTLKEAEKILADMEQQELQAGKKFAAAHKAFKEANAEILKRNEHGDAEREDD